MSTGTKFFLIVNRVDSTIVATETNNEIIWRLVFRVCNNETNVGNAI